MGKTLEYIFAGALALVGMGASGCMTPTTPQAKKKVTNKPAPKLVLEQELLAHIDANPEHFDLSDAVLMADTIEKTFYEFSKETYNSRIKALKQNPLFKQAKTTPEKVEAMQIFLHKGARIYKEHVSDVSSAMNGTGNCMAGSVYLDMVAQDLGINLESVLVEKHIFERLHHNRKKINIETTNQKGFDDKMINSGGRPLYSWEKTIGNKMLMAKYLYNLAGDREDLAEEARKKGDKQGAKKERLKAIPFYIASAKIHPEASAVFSTANLIRWNYGSNEEVKTIREIYARHSSNEIVAETLARALNYRNKPEDVKEATTLMLPIAKRYPKDEHKNSFLGALYAKQGNYDEAAKYFKLAVEANPRQRYKRELEVAIKNKIKQRVHKQVDRYYEEKK